MTGMIMTGETRLIILRETEEGYYDYRIEGDVAPYFGTQPKPGSVYVVRRGIAPDLWRIRTIMKEIGKAAFVRYEGPVEDYPYIIRGESN